MFFKNREHAKVRMSWDPCDIEEIHREAKRHVYCPYYATKDRVRGADLIFMPYNYLIDEKYRENFDLDLTNSIVIFDEAHNIAPCCEDVSSFKIRADSLDAVTKEVYDLRQTLAMFKDKEMESKDDKLELI